MSVSQLSDYLPPGYALFEHEHLAAYCLRFYNDYGWWQRIISYNDYKNYNIDLVRMHVFLLDQEIFKDLYGRHGNGD